MDDANQIEPPPSFSALYASRDGRRLTREPEFVIARYELCEDLALTLVQQLDALIAGSDTHQEIVPQLRQVLDATNSISAAETDWVLSRIAELSGRPVE
ncbi:MAG: hypothetical protein KKC79_20845 [Gammaproteobacteria bacterium]|nr:hypothetical protein [Gammaproteobacteria bacterium]MBU1440903.1 hypothetical protein [Gammaproteobacteria bacterium]MBU2288685.1 hypothetical protein [Gammaproteobacteria bacterium]MBU2411085.1 hypothetical protein [Gammaproteobacteria bacterium]